MADTIQPVTDADPQATVGFDAPTPDLPAAPAATPSNDTPGTYPTFYEKAAKARSAGYSWEEIGDHLVQGRAQAKAAGYTDAEINQHLGMSPSWDQAGTPLDYVKPQIPAGAGAEQAAQTIRDFTAKYLTADQDQPGSQPPAPIRSAGDFLKAFGHDIGDVGSIFGGGILQGLAATLEMMDGKPRSTEEWSQLNAEAMNFTGFLAGKGPGLKAADPRVGPLGIPATKDVIDAATSIVHPPEAPAIAAARDLLTEPASEPSGVAAAPTMPVVNMQSLKLMSQEAQLRQQHAELTELHGNIEVPPDAAAARDLLAKVDAVQREIDNPNVVGDELKTLKQRKDELLTDTNPETLREKAGALEMQRQTAAQLENVQAQLDDVRAQQAKLQADAALTPTPAGADMATVMRNLGQNFTDTGEHPLDAAARAQSDPALMAQLQAPHPDVAPAAEPAGGANTVFTDDMAAASRERLRARSSTFNSGIDPQDFADLAIIAGNHIERGARSFASFSARMVADVGEAVRPHLQALYDNAVGRHAGNDTNLSEMEGGGLRYSLPAPNGQPDGLLVEAARTADGNYRIAGSDSMEEMRGRGYGIAAYKALADEAIRRGAELQSDWQVSESAARMYDALGRRGYTVERSPDAALEDGTWYSDDHSPVFRVTEGPVPGDAPAPPVTPASVQLRNPAQSTGIIDNFKRIFNPASRSPEAAEAAGAVREAMAKQAQAGQMSSANLRRFGRAVADLSPEQQAAFIHAFESGDLSHLPPGSPLHEMAAEIKAELDVRWLKMDERNAAPGYIENYLPHLYEDADLALQRLPAYRGTKSASGSTPFLKERIFSSFLEAAQVLDLKPLTTNPIELVMTHLFQADKYIAKLDIVDELKAAGLIKAMPNDLTRAEAAEFAGTMRIDPSIAKGTGGQWVAAEPVATILNRWLAPGLTGQPIFDVLRSSGNMLNMAQLGMSAFHGGFVTAEAIASMVAKGVKQISRLGPMDVVRGAGNILGAPVTGPIGNLLVGRKVIQQILGKADFGPEVQTIADALIAGGGRVEVDPMYKASAMGSFWAGMKSSIRDGGEMSLAQDLQQMYHDAKPITIGGVPILPGAVRATAMLLPRVMDTISAPIMEGFVPMMKAGGFANLMADELRANPNMSPLEVRATASRIWHSIDNRLGQMVYDNRFWDKNLRDIGHVAVRSLGWTAGTIDEIGGGLLDLTQGRKISAGDAHQLTERAAYVIALPVATAMMGAMFGTVYGTWNTDWGIKDYLFPPTGGKDAQGGQERASMPGYLKDAYEWGTDPGHTALAKVHPLWSTVKEMMYNEDWNGAAITDPRKPFGEEAGDYATFLMKQFTPIVFQPRKASEAESGLGVVARQGGIRPAPYALREPERQAAWGMRDLVSRLKKKQRADGQ